MRRTGRVAIAQSAEYQEPEASSTPSSPRRRSVGLGLTLTIGAGALATAAVGALFWAQAYRSPSGVEVARSVGTATVDGVTVPHVTLSFQTYPDASGRVHGAAVHPGGNPSWPTYGLTNQFQVPAHALVTVSLRQYDSGGSLNNPWFATVRGTVGGVAIIDGHAVHSIDPDDVAHTFTVRGTPGTDPAFFLNVPLPAVGGNDQSDTGPYHSVVFSFVSGAPGVYAWNCEYPCGTMIAGFGGPMGAYGYMSGFIHVV